MSEYIWPIEPKYKVAEHDKYGIRKNHYVLFKQRAHSGFDITADIGTEVHPICKGKVLLADLMEQQLKDLMHLMMVTETK